MVTESLDATEYGAHLSELMRYATALVGPDDAPDVVSRVVVRVLSRTGKAPLREPRVYLMKAVLNESRSLLRRRRFLPLMEADVAITDPEPVPEVLQAVMQLPVRQRAAIFLVYWMDDTPSEAAALMGIRSGTVRRYLHLARHRLQEVLTFD